MKYKNLFGLALSVLALGATVASCTDANDWETDPTYNRMFGVNANKISLERNQDTPSTVSVTFNPIKGAEYYIVEVSTDSLYDDVPMGSGEHAIVFGQNKEFTKSPIELTGLAEETSYYMRMKTMSSTTPESHWVYYNSGASFKTLGIIYDVPAADILEDEITLHWIAGSEVTHIAYATTVDEQRDSVYRELTPDEIAASSCTVTGLNSNKTYNFYIYNNGQLRGTKTVKTAKPMPAADLKQELPENTTVIDQDLLDQLAAKALAVTGTNTATLTIGVPAGKTLLVGDKNEEGGDAGVVIPEGVSVTFFGMAGEVPTLQFKKSLDIGGNHSYVRFENVNIDGLYDATSGNKGCEYLINQDNLCSIDSLVFTDCNISNLQSALVRVKSDANGSRISKVRINNCVATNHAGNYQFLCFAKIDLNLSEIEITNSTFYKICQSKKAFIDIEEHKYDTNIKIESCTFYNLLGDGAYLINAKNAEGNNTASLHSLLLAKSFAETAKGYQGEIKVSATNSYTLNDFILKSNKFDMSEYNGSSEDVFTDPANGDFTLKPTDLINEKIGDPRWIPSL